MNLSETTWTQHFNFVTNQTDSTPHVCLSLKEHVHPEDIEFIKKHLAMVLNKHPENRNVVTLQRKLRRKFGIKDVPRGLISEILFEMQMFEEDCFPPTPSCVQAPPSPDEKLSDPLSDAPPYNVVASAHESKSKEEAVSKKDDVSKPQETKIGNEAVSKKKDVSKPQNKETMNDPLVQAMLKTVEHKHYNRYTCASCARQRLDSFEKLAPKGTKVVIGDHLQNYEFNEDVILIATIITNVKLHKNAWIFAAVMTKMIFGENHVHTVILSPCLEGLGGSDCQINGNLNISFEADPGATIKYNGKNMSISEFAVAWGEGVQGGGEIMLGKTLQTTYLK